MTETNNRYWIEEIKSDWTPFIDKSDVLDYDKILYILHDNQAFEDYPVAMSPNLNLLVGLCDRLNEYEIDVQQLKKENELLKQDLEHCANQFTNDGKNVLLGLK